MMLWIPKRAGKGGWSFYSITVPFSLVIIVIVLIALLVLWATDPPKQLQIVTEQSARLISIARSAASAEGFSLVDAIYQVRRDGDGWIVEVDKAPGYTGVGEPSVVVDGTFFVKLDAERNVREILSHGRSIKPATWPTPSIPPALPE